MSSTSPFDMFDNAITASQERERQDAERRAAEKAARAQKKLEEFLENFVPRFFAAVVNFGISTNRSTNKPHFTASQLKDARTYCEFLVSTEDMAFPANLNAYVVTICNDKFVYGALLAGDRLPVGHFLGQRQDWFSDALTKAKQSQARPKQRDVAGVSERERPEDCVNPVIPTPVAAKLAEAITPKAPKKKSATKASSRHLASAS